MKTPGTLAALTFVVATAVAAGDPAPAPLSGEIASNTVEVEATVTQIDVKTRELTIRTPDGEEMSFVADEAVKNLPQVKVGDVVRAVYVEALAYEVKKGGKPLGVEETVAGGSAEPGKKPAAAVGRQVTVTVTVTAIDPGVPSVTFKGPAGNVRTVKVRYPERLKGVSVGDAVDLTYTEALAVKVEPSTKKK